MELTEIEVVKQRQSVASNPDYSIWVNASAGSGKTTVLVKRLLRLLLNGVDPAKILCVTFTNTGAAEMRNRINTELANWSIYDDAKLEKEIVELEGSEEGIKEKIKKARILFVKILDASSDFKILTIHAFCQQIIKRFPLEAGLMPNFKVIDDVFSLELMNEAKDILLDLDDEEIQEAIANVTLYKNENDFFELLKDVVEKKDKFVYLKSKFFTIDEIVKEMFKIVNNEIKNCDLNSILNDFVNYNDFSESYQTIFDNLEVFGKDTDKKNVPILEKWQKSTPMQRKDMIKEYLNVFISTSDKPRERIICVELQRSCMGFESLLKEEIDRVFNFFNTRNNFINIMFIKDILKIAYKMFDIYDMLKKQNSCLDYNDLIIKTTELLNEFGNANMYSNWINYKLDSGIDHLLIDEAQDTSPIQWNIINSLTQEFFVGIGQGENLNRTIFVVGDEKQSIFSFQGADPNIFYLKFEEYRRDIENCGKKFQEIYMETSFRSLISILQITDEVFKDGKRRNAISKNDKPIKHSVVRKEALGKVELWPLIGEDVEKKKEKEPWAIDYEAEIELTNKQKLAQFIAEKIKYWFDNGKLILDKKTKEKRLIKYSDIMILVRKRNKDFINYLIREFNKKNIPTMGNDRFDLLNNIVAEDILALCNFVLFPDDNLNLANLFKSPILGLSESDLYLINKNRLDNSCSLWESLQSCNTKAQLLVDLINQGKELSLYEFLFYIFETRGIRKAIKSRFVYMADEIINEFLNLAKKYENDNINATLISFIDFLKNTRIVLKRDMDQDIDEVRIITVHSSKGLESPIVILPDANKTSGKNDVLKFCRNFELGYEMPFVKVEHSKFFANLEDNIKGELDKEYLRLLYVAMTRAGNELYICDYKNSKKENSKSWYELIKNAIEPIAKKDDYRLYIGDEDEYDECIFEKNESDINKEFIAQVVENIKKPTKLEKSAKIINPSIFFGEAMDVPKKQNNKGQAVHKILEILPNIDFDKREKVMDQILNRKFADLENKNEIKNTALSVLNNERFGFLFRENSKAEVPIFGKIGDDIISGKIDRLVVNDDFIYVVDYKTNGVIPKKIPEKYVKQLELYKNLLEKLYKNKTIKCYILWTSFGKIDEVVY